MFSIGKVYRKVKGNLKDGLLGGVCQHESTLRISEAHRKATQQKIEQRVHHAAYTGDEYITLEAEEDLWKAEQEKAKAPQAIIVPV